MWKNGTNYTSCKQEQNERLHDLHETKGSDCLQIPSMQTTIQTMQSIHCKQCNANIGTNCTSCQQEQNERLHNLHETKGSDYLQIPPMQECDLNQDISVRMKSILLPHVTVSRLKLHLNRNRSNNYFLQEIFWYRITFWQIFPRKQYNCPVHQTADLESETQPLIGFPLNVDFESSLSVKAMFHECNQIQEITDKVSGKILKQMFQTTKKGYLES